MYVTARTGIPGLTTLYVLALLLVASLPALHAQTSRTDRPLAQNWRFHLGPIPNGQPGHQEDASWGKVSIPHSWSNAEAVPGKDFFAGESWYSERFPTEKEWKDKRVFLRFEAVSLIAEVFLNGKRLGEHHGGFAAFAYEITSELNPAGENRLEVRVDNKRRDDVSPLGGDFTIYGGIYRPVSVIVTGPVDITPLDFASPGVFLKQTAVSAASATVEIRTEVNSTRTGDTAVSVRATLQDRDGRVVLTAATPHIIASGGTVPVVQSITIPKPHLWNGVADPYLYHVKVDLIANGRTIDSVTQPLGLRSERFDSAHGFVLNEGAPTQMHGACLHQEFDSHGWAVTPAEEAQDLRIMREMGINAVRLVHYQHSESFLDAADREGILVWAELTQVDHVSASQAYHDNIQQQLFELIRQNYNHPSIFVWSLYNELNSPTKAIAIPLIKELNELAHKEDPTRPTTGAASGDTISNLHEMVAAADLISDNNYAGWYGRTPAEMDSEIVKWNKAYGSRGLSISEYGAGASIHDHKQGIVSGEIKPNGHFHPEEWQSAVHEGNYKAISSHPEVWGSFLWVMFDFASIGRHEGDTDGVNDKGLVTRDRATRKDAYFFYQASWTSKPMVYLTSRRAVERTSPTTDIKVYSNQAAPRLTLNGHDLGPGTETQLHVFVWKDAALSPGPNAVHVSAGSAVDDCVWTYRPDALPAVR